MPYLQPTDERRRSGSHYTPRSLTEPIVRHALEPAFERIGADASPEAVLSLKVLDPACGSGAFLVEACRQLGARLEQAWDMHKAEKPTIPPDEDEVIHARRLVAQRCLYGVDRNPMAVDLARLSLWLATLAREHEFSFLDHAIKAGDSLVGLTQKEIEAANWDDSKPGLPLYRHLIRDEVRKALEGREAIRTAPDDVTRAIQESRHRRVEEEIEPARQVGDAVIAAFFSVDKAKAREQARTEVESWITAHLRPEWDKIESAARRFRIEQGWRPFHWQIEFPEVFIRDNPGFDGIVGNPPFAGKNTISAGSGPRYLPWLQQLHEGAHGNADLVAHFFRRAFKLLREGGAFGLIATNTIGQGDTRQTGLAAILASGGSIYRAIKRYKWPNEGAAVVVSILHVAKGPTRRPTLDGRGVERISAYLVDGALDGQAKWLAANADKAFQGSILLGVGFTFDDMAAARGEAESLETMRRLVVQNPLSAQLIKPYIGGDEVNSSPTHAHHRYAFDFFARPLDRSRSGSWTEMDEREKARCLVIGIVPQDYPGEVAEDWPELVQIAQERVKPLRDRQTRKALRERWWQGSRAAHRLALVGADRSELSRFTRRSSRRSRFRQIGIRKKILQIVFCKTI